MAARLILVVLTLLGAVPVRICTCGAAHHHPQLPPASRDAEPELPRDSLPAIVTAPVTEHHDADCHAIKPRPLMSVGLQFDVTDPPAADTLAVALFEPPRLEATPGHAPRDFHPPPNRPLFLTYIVLRN